MRVCGASKKHNPRSENLGLLAGKSGGDETRTRDLIHAMDALYQLSYAPGDSKPEWSKV